MVRVRFAPSPTGELHVGGARTALYNYLFAQKMGGKFIIRIEDTDQERFVDGSRNRLLEGLTWLGITWDEGPDVGGAYGPYVQSERKHLYKKYADELVIQHAAYYCFCSSERLDTLRKSQEAQKLPTKYDRACLNLSADEVAARLGRGESHVIRLHVPAGQTTFTDTVRGDITVANETIDDQVLMKSDGFPTYHLANIVDDHLMEITHVIRGEEWLPSTPKHVLLYQAFGWKSPEFAHLPNVLNDKRAKLSKRKDGAAVWVQTYQQAGFLPQALMNFLSLLGWHPSDDKELYTLAELVQAFDLSRVQKTGAIFNLQKLNWFNAEYIKALSVENLDAKLTPIYINMMAKARVVTNTQPLTGILQSRLVTLGDAREHAKWFFVELPELSTEILIPKNSTAPKTVAALTATMAEWDKVGEWQIADLKTALEALVATNQFTRGELLWPVRVALTGERQSPDVFEVAWALGREESLKRLVAAKNYFN